MLDDHVYIMFSHRGSSSLLSSSILVEITEPEILVNRTERKRKHAQTFSSFDDFLNKYDGDYKSPGKEDCSTSDSECISGDGYEEDVPSKCARVLFSLKMTRWQEKEHFN